MIYKAKHHWFLNPFFHWYARYIIQKNFNNVDFDFEFKDKKLPVLLLANHSSWWDGFYASYVNHKLINRRFHIMMQEEQLLKYHFFNKTGAFSVKKKSRSILETFKYTGELLTDASNMVVIYPQGEIQSVFENELIFENGISHLVNNLNNSIHLLFMVTLTEYFSNKKPVLCIYIKEYLGELEKLKGDFNKFYKDCKNLNCSKKSY